MLTEDQKRDYPEFEGAVIKYIDGPETLDVRVIGLNYHVGISIVANSNNINMVCIPGPLAPNYQNDGLYDQDFEFCLNSIISGVIDLSKVPESKDIQEHTFDGPLYTCPFSL